MDDAAALLPTLGHVLDGVDGVSGAAYFGSMARGDFDDLSDIDLIVRCSETVADAVAASIHSTLDVCLYRPFTRGRAPSGRYWFTRAHPFARLDVSFHREVSYDRIAAEGDEYVHPPLRPPAISGGGRHAPVGQESPNRWSQQSFDFAGALRDYQEAVKARVRGRPPKRSVEETVRRIEPFELTVHATEWDLYLRSAEIARLRGIA